MLLCLLVSQGRGHAQFAVMGCVRRFGGLVLGRGLTLRQADGCAGGARREQR